MPIQKSRIIAEVPSFGADYTWCISPHGATANKDTALHHFSVGASSEIDTLNFRLKVLKSAKKYKDAYVFLDATKTLYDMSGRPVWYLPRCESKDATVRDMKLSPQGSITYVIDEQGVYDINYNGDLLWKGPNDGAISGDNAEHYHHEFTKLTNGNYMALAQNFQFWKNPAQGDTTLVTATIGQVKPDELNTLYSRTPLWNINRI